MADPRFQIKARSGADLSTIDIPSPPRPWRSSPASIARDADIAALRRTLRPSSGVLRRLLIALPIVVLVVVVLASVFAPLLISATLTLAAAR